MIAIRTVAMALGLIAGIVAASLWKTPVGLAPVFGFSFLALCFNIYLLRRERAWKEWPHLLVVFSVVLFSLPIGYWRTMQAIGPPPTTGLRHVLDHTDDGTQLVIEGHISHEPELRTAKGGDLRIRVTKIRPAAVTNWTTLQGSDEIILRTYAYPTSAESGKKQMIRLMRPHAFGYRVRFKSSYRSIAPINNPGEFDYGAFLQQNGLAGSFRCYAGNVEIIEESAGAPLVEIALAAKYNFLATYKQTIRAPVSRLVAAATLGTRRAVEKVSFMDKDIAETFRHAGVGHVLAVSGLHVSVVTILLYSLFRMAGARPRIFVPPLIGFLILFALLTGARPSSVRAVIMNAVVLIALAYFRCSVRKATAVGLSLSSVLILVCNPMILFAPSFLLSYGAVLSLVLISPTIDRWLHMLRGASLFLFLGWFLLFLTICIVRFDFFLHSTHCIGFLALLWLCVRIGGYFNNRYSRLWRIGFERIPATLGMFISAQLAIQAGMMVPLSAWFFGRFPVAGVVVNLLAIPLVGLLVQLGILTGLLGLIPFIGLYLALPLGAADTVIGAFFYRLAHAGATLFPFPATPRPTLLWMGAYFAGLGAVLLIDAWRVRVQEWIYRLWPTLHGSRTLARGLRVLPVILLLLPVLSLIPRTYTCERITCLADSRYPIVTLLSSDHRAMLINAGEEITGQRMLFSAIRDQGATLIDHAILAGTHPRSGNEGIAGVSTRMKIGTCHVPVLVDDPATYVDAIGDPFLSEEASKQKSWATDYQAGFSALHAAADESPFDLRLFSPGDSLEWKGTGISACNQPASPPQRQVASDRTLMLNVDANGFRWLIITDTTPRAIEEALREEHRQIDVLVLPNLSSRSSYAAMAQTAITLTKPRVLIVAGERIPKNVDMDDWKAQTSAGMLCTAIDGAIEATFDNDGAMTLRGFRSANSITLPPRP